MQFVTPQEPTLFELRNRINIDDRWLDIRLGRQFTNDWIAKQAVPVLLWHRWKPGLQVVGLSFNDFQSIATEANETIEAWVTGEARWGAVISQIERAVRTSLYRT